MNLRARDIYESESEWGALEVKMPISKPYFNTLIYQFLENHPHLFPMLRQLLDFQ